jgi:osmoprotectant transport system permease protein
MLDALRPLVDAIDVTRMRAANLRATGGGGASPKQAARWLWEEVGKAKR